MSGVNRDDDADWVKVDRWILYLTACTYWSSYYCFFSWPYHERGGGLIRMRLILTAANEGKLFFLRFRSRTRFCSSLNVAYIFFILISVRIIIMHGSAARVYTIALEWPSWIWDEILFNALWTGCVAAIDGRYRVLETLPIVRPRLSPRAKTLIFCMACPHVSQETFSPKTASGFDVFLTAPLPRSPLAPQTSGRSLFYSSDKKASNTVKHLQNDIKL